MIAVDIPGGPRLRLEHVVCDFNGTLARDGRLVRGVHGRLNDLARHLSVHVVTADTFGSASRALRGLDLDLEILPSRGQVAAKRDYVSACGAKRSVAIGNGRNDAAMLKIAALSIAVLGDEGTAATALAAATIVARDIVIALDLLLDPRRLTATLRR